MTINTHTKINNLGELLAEKARLKSLCLDAEKQLEYRLDYISENYVELTVDYVIMPAVKKTFKMDNILGFFGMGPLSDISSGNENKGNQVLSLLSGLFGKTGWLMALKLGYSVLKKFIK